MDQAASNLLRFTSRELPITTRVDTTEYGRFVVLLCDEVEVGRRRLNKRSCCRSNSPCIGPIIIAPEVRDRFGIPAVVHVSICFDELNSGQ